MSQPKLQSQLLGKQGEEIAALYLQKLGFRILFRNYKIRYGEIDIIAVDGNTLVFIEVKTRIDTMFGTPAEAVTPRKLHEIITTSKFFKATHNKLPESMRIDVIAILMEPEGKINSLNYIPNVTG